MADTTNAKAFDFLLRHFVILSVRAMRPDGTEVRQAYSCFLMDVRGQWLLVTAGHILADLEEVLRTPGYRVLESNLFDCWQRAGALTPIPFSLGDSARFHIDAEGVDVGFFLVPPLIRRTMASVGAEPFLPAAWKIPDEGLEFDAYAIIGVPSEFISVSESGLSVEPVLLPVRPSDPPADLRKRKPHAFFGSLASNLQDREGDPLEDIDGMSGGPILGFRNRTDGPPTYHLLAIQGGWFPDTRIIYGTHAYALGRGLEMHIEEFEQGRAR